MTSLAERVNGSKILAASRDENIAAGFERSDKCRDPRGNMIELPRSLSAGITL